MLINLMLEGLELMPRINGIKYPSAVQISQNVG